MCWFLLNSKMNRPCIYIYSLHFVLSSHPGHGFPVGSDGEESACKVRGLGSIPGLGRSPVEQLPNSSILAWRIPWAVQSIEFQLSGMTKRLSLSFPFVSPQYIK